MRAEQKSSSASVSQSGHHGLFSHNAAIKKHKRELFEVFLSQLLALSPQELLPGSRIQAGSSVLDRRPPPLPRSSVVTTNATDYARTRPDCIHFHSFTMGMPTDAVRGIFDTLGHSNGPIFLPITVNRHPPKRAHKGMCWVHDGN